LIRKRSDDPALAEINTPKIIFDRPDAQSLVINLSGAWSIPISAILQPGEAKADLCQSKTL
jgi:hypothetical protein